MEVRHRDVAVVPREVREIEYVQFLVHLRTLGEFIEELLSDIAIERVERRQ